MWKWNEELTVEMNLNKNLVDQFRKSARISGILFILFGAAGIFFPTFMSLTTLAFVAYLMLFAGIMSGYMTWTTNRESWVGWLKSLMLILVAVFMIFYPMQGIATLGLLFAIYFLVDAFAEFGLAFSLYPQKIWIMWLLNAIASLMLGVIFVIGWPFNSLFLVGMLVGISLLFDGIALLAGGAFLEEMTTKKD